MKDLARGGRRNLETGFVLDPPSQVVAFDTGIFTFAGHSKDGLTLGLDDLSGLFQPS